MQADPIKAIHNFILTLEQKGCSVQYPNGNDADKEENILGEFRTILISHGLLPAPKSGPNSAVPWQLYRIPGWMLYAPVTATHSPVETSSVQPRSFNTGLTEFMELYKRYLDAYVAENNPEVFGLYVEAAIGRKYIKVLIGKLGKAKKVVGAFIVKGTGSIHKPLTPSIPAKRVLGSVFDANFESLLERIGSKLIPRLEFF